jgi:hypothetical protein
MSRAKTRDEAPQRQRAPKGSLGYALLLQMPEEWKGPLKRKAKADGAPSVSEWIRTQVGKALGQG